MNKIKVWDPVVRIVHWCLAAAVLINFLNEGGETWHRWEGYAAVGLVVTRLLWGFVGSHYARFSEWFPTPRRLIPYVKGMLRGDHPRYLGHNPAGAVMMLFLLVMVLGMGTTGYLMGTDAFFGEEWLEELHEIMAYTMLGGVGLHVLAAIVESRRHKENLPAAMIHGYKRVDSAVIDVIDVNEKPVEQH
ncbi:cytochrome b/b6 domain-containing protein [Chitinibacter bivalviorum]|uniref:Cytochrome b/b6 domain-containing protein n=1 Tax=Chitinibacter bivalviorum TaxID=2739434 RepID=A0A7H9BKF7_9NEIS|nr:cytochrome b/b6 domain-containing protein [Chitinibacter bivalviorum]QLG89053.1 cytochrome b/b6 domain-containing protein [Chitinibacter bivalviorum]